MPKAPAMARVQRLLIVKLSSLGDVVHALPVSAALGEAFPHLRLTWVVEERSAPLVLGNPYLHEVMVLPDDWHRLGAPGGLARWWRLRRELRRRRFDVALDLQGLTRSAALAWASGARWRFGWNYLRELAPLLVRRVKRVPRSVHVVDQLLDVARFLGAPAPRVRFPLRVSPEDAASAELLLHKAGIPTGQPFLAVNPTTGATPHKGPGVEQWVGLLALLAGEVGLPAVLVGGGQDRVLEQAILVRAKPRPISLVGRTTIGQLMAVLRRACLHVCGDTGSGHLAAALGTPVVSLFGRTDPARSAPYGQSDWALYHSEKCIPRCRRYRLGAPVNRENLCFQPPPSCLAAITPAEIVASIRRRLESLSGDTLAA